MQLTILAYSFYRWKIHISYQLFCVYATRLPVLFSFLFIAIYPNPTKNRNLRSANTQLCTILYFTRIQPSNFHSHTQTHWKKKYVTIFFNSLLLAIYPLLVGFFKYFFCFYNVLVCSFNIIFFSQMRINSIQCSFPEIVNKFVTFANVNVFVFCLFHMPPFHAFHRCILCTCIKFAKTTHKHITALHNKFSWLFFSLFHICIV